MAEFWNVAMRLKAQRAFVEAGPVQILSLRDWTTQEAAAMGGNAGSADTGELNSLYASILGMPVTEVDAMRIRVAVVAVANPGCVPALCESGLLFDPRQA